MPCDDYTDPYASDPPTCSGWTDSNAPYSEMPEDSNGLYYVTPPYGDTDPSALGTSDCDYLLDIDDNTADSSCDESGTYSYMQKTLRIHLRRIRIRLRTEDPCFWKHLRSLFHQRMVSEAIQEMLHWEQVHPQGGGQ